MLHWLWVLPTALSCPDTTSAPLLHAEVGNWKNKGGRGKENMQNKVAWGKEALHCREKECTNARNFILPCVHAILHTYTLKQTITGKINAEFKEVWKKSLCFWNLPFFNVHYGAPIPSATWNLQSVFLLPELSAVLVHQSSGNSSPLHSYRISSKMLPQANGWELFLTICWGFLSQKCTTKTLQFKELFCLFVFEQSHRSCCAGPTHVPWQNKYLSIGCSRAACIAVLQRELPFFH